MGLIHIDLFTTLDGVAQAPGGPEEDPEGGFEFGGWQAPLFDDAGRRAGRRRHGGTGRTAARPAHLRHLRRLLARPGRRASTRASPGCSTTFRSTSRHGAHRRSTGRTPRCSAPTSPRRLRELRERHANMHVIGSLDLVQTLVAEGLFDRLTLWIYPIVLGTGKQVFADGAVPSNLTLVEPAITSPRGAVLVRYARADGTPSTGDMARADRGSAPGSDQ